MKKGSESARQPFQFQKATKKSIKIVWAIIDIIFKHATIIVEVFIKCDYLNTLKFEFLKQTKLSNQIRYLEEKICIMHQV